MTSGYIRSGALQTPGAPDPDCVTEPPKLYDADIFTRDRGDQGHGFSRKIEVRALVSATRARQRKRAAAEAAALAPRVGLWPSEQKRSYGARRAWGAVSASEPAATARRVMKITPGWNI